MLVNSAIELYTMLLAWHLYDGFWAILSGTGIGALPFAVIIISTILDFQEKENVGSKQLVRALEVRLYTALAVFFIAVTPFIDLHTENTRYIEASCPADDSSAATTKEKSFADTDTTLDGEAMRYDSMFAGGKIPQAPLWWYAFSHLNLAIANSLKFELPCRADIVSVTANLAKANITDPDLRNEAAHFNNQCWLPSTNKFLAQRYNLAIGSPDIPPHLNTPDKPITKDVSWFGSTYFLDTPGYYDTFRTDVGLRSVPYSNIPGEDDSPVSDGADGLGWPTCDRWWRGCSTCTGTPYGLRSRLMKDVGENSMNGKMDDWNEVSKQFFATPTEAGDELLKAAIIAPGTQSPNAKLPIAQTGTAKSQFSGKNIFSLDAIIDAATSFGIAYKGASALLEAHALKQGAPVIQAFVLMLFVIVLPLLMLLSLYDLGTLVTLTVVQFSVMFWSFLFALAGWLNNFLVSVLWSHGLHFDGDQTTEFEVTMWIIKFTYVVLPIIFSTLLGVAGRNLGLGIEKSMTGMMSGAGKAADAGASGLKNTMARRAGK